MKKVILLGLAVIAVFVVIGVAKGFLDAKATGGSPALRERRLVEISKRMNQGLPKPVDQETILDTTKAGPGIRFTFVYKLINRSSADVDATRLATALKPRIINNYRTLPELADFRKWQVEVHYQYCDKDGKEITTVLASPNDL